MAWNPQTETYAEYLDRTGGGDQSDVAAPVAAPAAPAPAAGPASALAQDPAYLAFLRSSGLVGEVAAADVARRKAGLEAALGLGVEDLERQGERTRRGIAGEQESRGVFRSGQTLTRQGEQEEDQARRRSALELAAAGDLGDLETSLLSTLAEQQLKGSEAGLATGTDLYKRNRLI